MQMWQNKSYPNTHASGSMTLAPKSFFESIMDRSCSASMNQ